MTRPIRDCRQTSDYESVGRRGISSKQIGSLASEGGSEQEFDGTRNLGCFLEDDEFGLDGGHALSLQQQIAQILVAAAAA